ncbi:hypothetical protein QKW52_14575 [Bacillus sonorensis]|nr:hypothetical protein [Bacillus sonorensis]
MIDSLKESINQTKDTSKDRSTGVEETKKQLDGFVENVNQYKKYQQEQSKLLMAAQADSEKQIQTGLTSINEKQASTSSTFAQRMNGMTTAFGNLQTQFGEAARSNKELQDYRYDQIPQQQLGQIGTIQSALISEYKKQARQYTLNQIETPMLKNREKLFESNNNETPKEEEPGDDGKEEPGDDEDNKNIEINLDDEANELEKISKELEDLSNNIQVPNKEEPESPSPGENDGTAEDNTSTDPAGNGQTDENKSNNSDEDGQQTDSGNNVDDTTNEDPTPSEENPGDQDGNNLEELKKS